MWLRGNTRGGSCPLLTGHWLPSICHPYRWKMDGNGMVKNVHQLRPKPGDSEKITVNLGYVDLGHIDLNGPGGLLLEPDRFLFRDRNPQPDRAPRRRGQAVDGPERTWTSVCGTTAAKISKAGGAAAGELFAHPSAGPRRPSRRMSRPELARAHDRLGPSCWERLHASPAVKGRRSPTGCGDRDDAASYLHQVSRRRLIGLRVRTL